MVVQLFRAQVAIQDSNTLSRDRFVNNLYFTQIDSASVLDPFTISTAIKDFYSVSAGIGAYLSPTFAATLSTIKFYDMNEPLESPPVAQYVLPMGAGTGAPLPSEVACCLTFHGIPQDGLTPRQSWRGRIYIGPLSTNAMDTGIGGESRPKGAFALALTQAGKMVHDECVVGNSQWVIASKARQKLYPVSIFSVDNAWDTQRRRGVSPTTSTVGEVLDGPSEPIPHTWTR